MHSPIRERKINKEVFGKDRSRLGQGHREVTQTVGNRVSFGRGSFGVITAFVSIDMLDAGSRCTKCTFSVTHIFPSASCNNQSYAYPAFLMHMQQTCSMQKSEHSMRHAQTILHAHAPVMWVGMHPCVYLP